MPRVSLLRLGCSPVFIRLPSLWCWTGFRAVIIFLMGLLTQVALILYQNRMSSLEESMFGIKADRRFNLHSIVDFPLSTFHLFFLHLICSIF